MNLVRNGLQRYQEMVCCNYYTLLSETSAPKARTHQTVNGCATNFLSFLARSFNHQSVSKKAKYYIRRLRAYSEFRDKSRRCS